MENIYRQVPVTVSEKNLFGFPNKQQQLGGLRGQMGGFHNKTSTYQRPQLLKGSEENWQGLRGENVMGTSQHPCWSTVIPLGGIVRNEQQVKVQLNPQYRVLVIKLYPRGTRGSNLTSPQKIHHIISLPKNIRMDQLQVKLTQRGDLVVFAPFKFPQHQQQQQGWEDIMKDTYLFQQHQGMSGFHQGMNIPVKYTTGSRKNFRSTSPFRGTTTSTSESESDSTTTTSTSGSESSTTSCSSTSSCTSSSSESESENEKWNVKNLKKRRGSSRRRSLSGSSDIKVKAQKFVRLLQKIFFPLTVECKIKQVPTTTSTQTSQQLQLVVDIKSTQFTSQNQVKCCVHQTQPNMLIIESQRVHTDRLTGTEGVKYVRRVIRVPRWLDVQQMVYRVKEQGWLRIKLPITLTNFSGINTFPYGLQYGKQGSYSGMGKSFAKLLGGRGEKYGKRCSCHKC